MSESYTDPVAGHVRALRMEYERAATPRAVEGDPRLVPGPGNKHRKFSLRHPELWYKKLFIAKCKSFGIHAYRHQSDPSLMNHVDTTEQFFQQVLWPEFQDHIKTVSIELSNMVDVILGESGPAQDELVVPDTHP